MIFNSLEFILFFPIAVLVYYWLPVKYKKLWLLLASYVYYMSAGVKYIGYLLFSTMVTWLGGLAIERAFSPVKRKWLLAASIVINLSILVFFKCGALFFSYQFLLPVGISFFTFQSITYVVSVYRKELPAEKNLLTYGLFVAFFPNILAGPIERAKHLLPQFDKNHTFSYVGIRLGLAQMLWGFFIKMVLAERFAIVANMIFNEYTMYSGFETAIGIISYGMQIYCDFLSYSTIAVGAAGVMGFELIENFKQPYFATSVADFWRRWHISLSSWFRDYIYIPLGGSRKGRIRKYTNLLIVFLVSGLWHGSTWNYLIWGGLNGVYQIAGDICSPIKGFAEKKLPKKLFRACCILITFLLIQSTWVFFRSGTFTQALGIFKQLFASFNMNIFWNGRIFELGLGIKNLVILLVNFMLFIIFDILNEKNQNKNGQDAFTRVFTLPLAVRWGIYYFVIGMILLSSNLSSSEFIYMQY